MRRIARSLIFMSALILGGAYLETAAQDPPPKKLKLPRRTAVPDSVAIDGYYSMSGQETTPKGEKKSYSGGTVTIKKDEGRYILIYAYGGASYRGVGLRKNGVLSVGWTLPAPAGLQGVTVYEILREQKVEKVRDKEKETDRIILVGEWVALPPASNLKATEKLGFLIKMEPDEE